MKSKLVRTLTVGFAVFAMLFGAGNLIFPPFLGMNAGSNWIIGFAGFALIDVIITMIGFNIIAAKDDGVNDIVGILGPVLSKLFIIVIYVCIGPLVAIPRTAATTYELGIKTFFPGFSPVLFSVIFFAVTFILCIKPSRIIDIIGSVLAPVLLITLAILIVKGIITPIGTIINNSSAAETAKTGILTGYQTMDTTAIITFSVIIFSQIKSYELGNRRKERKMMAGSTFVAGLSLLLVYGGLSYLGATVSGVYPEGINRSDLIMKLAEDILGKPGKLLLAVIVGAACLTTAIGLVSSTAVYFHDLFKKKIPYGVMVFIICAMSAVICNIGLENIIAFAAPILGMLYPVFLLMLVLSVISERVMSRATRIGGLIGALLFAVLEFAETVFDFESLTAKLPLASIGFAWVIPALLGMLLGTVLTLIKGRSRVNIEVVNRI